MKDVIEGIQAVLGEILDAHPAGFTEHELLKKLAEHEVSLFGEEYFNSPLGLFQRHFLLFHCLYVLRDKLRAAQRSDLEIHCLGIRQIAYRNTPSDHPAQFDPLAAYYLELDNFTNTDEQEVLRLLNDFWKRFSGDEQRDKALAVMGLAHPVSYPEIRQQYRRLAMQCHPDRGGELAQFQRLEWSMGILRVLYRAN
ncbi:MAG: DnaJ domain-containing protein [Gammaproteobacteria bacterium]|nr:molecular chaperone DnaJ [Sideroxydans sp.]MBU3902727.1 DnaJ domain-containing protein [Gammaproteobacteria bacterium]MBU4046279.1 DnaJ domain-containing protein [Gammaproteobacteria bacterium]MBU4150520.1 DnaJ domain-containing protein [Gammaproteobacteria bacterium]